MPLLARLGLLHTYDNHPSLMRQPWFAILQSTVLQSEKGLTRTKGSWDIYLQVIVWIVKLITEYTQQKVVLRKFWLKVVGVNFPQMTYLPLDKFDASVVRPSSNLGWKEGTHFHTRRHKGGYGSLWWVVLVPSGWRAGWSIECWVKHSRAREPCDRVFVAIENWRGGFALVIALKSLVLHVVGIVYLKCISVANPYTNDQDLSLQRVTKR